VNTLGRLWNIASSVKGRLNQCRWIRRWESFRVIGTHIGNHVYRPSSTWIDTEHCHLISIGDHCGLGNDCVILADDDQIDELLDAGRIGRVVLHSSCHFDARTVILAGLECKDACNSDQAGV
jgi:ribosomal protein L36